MKKFNTYQEYVNGVASGYELSELEDAGIKAISQELAYNIVGMSGEAGEVLEKMKKSWRDVGLDNIYAQLSEEEARHGLALELGDVLYYIARTANLLGYDLSEIVEMHVDKLNGRLKRGTIKGEGDYR
jgi:NTP pyrophosphatase (non-canonical NTP hydrolase)